jgi:hypothetical protein
MGSLIPLPDQGGKSAGRSGDQSAKGESNCVPIISASPKAVSAPGIRSCDNSSRHLNPKHDPFPSLQGEIAVVVVGIGRARDESVLMKKAIPVASRSCFERGNAERQLRRESLAASPIQRRGHQNPKPDPFSRPEQAAPSPMRRTPPLQVDASAQFPRRKLSRPAFD